MTTVGASVLDSSVLVLNRLFVAIHVISARRAFCLLCKELAEVVSYEEGRYASYDFESWRELSEMRAQFKDQYEDADWVRTVRWEIQVPRIIRLLFYDKLPKQTVKFNRRNIFARDANRCQYCGRRFPTSELSLDHVIPRSMGGKSTWTNVVCACLECNVRKGGRTPEQAGMRLIAPPQRPKRNPVLSIKLSNAKYQSWKAFVDNAYWEVELRE